MASDLIYYPDDRPGITRRRCGRGFSYYAPSGALIRDPGERARIKALAVPPDYDDVWITPEPRAHLQATGRDARGRKQYIYHDDWRARRDELKFDQLPAFGRALPKLRRFIATGLGAPRGSRELALALALALLDRAALRLGSRRYADENDSYGAVTLLDRHVKLDNAGVDLAFAGKRGRPVEVHLHGNRLQAALEKINDLPGAELLSWLDMDGGRHVLRSEQVNETLREICGAGASAKTFRTWSGTQAAFAVARQTTGTLRIGDMAGAASERLHNTPAIARNSYIHPRVIALADLGVEERVCRLDALAPVELSGLRAHEGRLIALLESS